jgi:hypothetical protein
MPIRINLLAEQIAAEEERRRDPVKRATLWGSVAILLFACWIALGQARLAKSVHDRDRIRHRLATVDKGSGEVKANLQSLREAEDRLASLYRLATNRYLWGSTFEALQMLPVSTNLRLLKLEGRHAYVVTNQGSAKPAKSGTAKPSRLPTAIETITLRITGQDLGRPEDGNIPQFQRLLAQDAFFGLHLASNGISMVEWSQPMPLPNEPQRTFVQFALECRYAEKERRK